MQLEAQKVTTEDGEQVWRIDGIRCVDCQVEMPLLSDFEPGRLAMKQAAARIRRCDDCLSKIEAAEDLAVTREAVRKRVDASNLPADLQGMFFNEMLDERGRKFVTDAVRHWTEDRSPVEPQICLYGTYGCGKTRLAATAAWARLQRWHITWVSMPVLLAQLGAAFTDKARQSAVRVLAGKGALVLDDLDKANPTQWSKQQMFAAIDTRIQAGSPLLITTNLRPDRLVEKLGDDELGRAIMSRVAGMKVYELPGRDNRIEMGG